MRENTAQKFIRQPNHTALRDTVVSALRVNINAAQLQHRVRRCVARPRVVYRFRRWALGATW